MVLQCRLIIKKAAKFIQYKRLNLFSISVNIFIADAKQSMVVAL